MTLPKTKMTTAKKKATTLKIRISYWHFPGIFQQSSCLGFFFRGGRGTNHSRWKHDGSRPKVQLWTIWVSLMGIFGAKPRQPTSPRKRKGSGLVKGIIKGSWWVRCFFPWGGRGAALPWQVIPLGFHDQSRSVSLCPFSQAWLLESPLDLNIRTRYPNYMFWGFQNLLKVSRNNHPSLFLLFNRRLFDHLRCVLCSDCLSSWVSDCRSNLMGCFFQLSLFFPRKKKKRKSEPLWCPVES